MIIWKNKEIGDSNEKNYAFYLLCFVSVLSSQEIEINFLERTIDGVDISSCNIDNITDIFGRPSVVNKNEILQDILGPVISYHSLGLQFRFNAKSKDPDQKCLLLMVYLSKAWDEDNGKYYVFDSDKISIVPEISGNLKSSKLIEYFSLYDYNYRTASEREAEFKELYGDIIPIDINENVLRIEMDSFYINYMFEEVTDFLESASVIFESAK
jgi:hypothetical protein